MDVIHEKILGRDRYPASLLAAGILMIAGCGGTKLKSGNKNHAPLPREEVTTITPATMTAFLSNYAKGVAKLQTTVPIVDDLGVKGCKIQPARVNEKPSSTSSDSDSYTRVESHDKRGGYQFIVGKNGSKLFWLDIERYNLSGCNGVENADQGINIYGGDKGWEMIVDFANEKRGTSNAGNYSTDSRANPNSDIKEAPLTPQAFDVFTNLANTILDDAAHQRNVATIDGLPNIGDGPVYK